MSLNRNTSRQTADSEVKRERDLIINWLDISLRKMTSAVKAGAFQFTRLKHNIIFSWSWDDVLNVRNYNRILIEGEGNNAYLSSQAYSDGYLLLYWKLPDSHIRYLQRIDMTLIINNLGLLR